MKTAIFDFDGTLFETSSYWGDIIGNYLKNKGITPPDDLLMLVKPLGLKGAVEMLKKDYSIEDDTDAVVEKWLEIMSDNYKFKVPLNQGAGEYVMKLKNEGIHLCVATAMERVFVEMALKRVELYSVFDYIVTIADVNADKTSPAIYLNCAEKFNSLPQECTVFEDSYKAAMVARKAGFHTIGVYDGICVEELKELKAATDRVIMSYSVLM